MRAAAAPRRLSAEEARFRADVRALGIKSSDDAHAPGSFGDPRGARALEVALAVAGPGYHAYLCDLEGTDRLERVAALVRPMLRSEKTLWDWVYVHNFLDANRPRAIRLTAGEGRQLRGEIEALLRGLRDDLPKAFREEAFESEKSSVVESFEQRARTRRDELAEMGKRAGFTLVFAPDGNIAAVPMLDGRPIASEEEFKQLEQIGYQLGFENVASGPMVRSSYHADRQADR